MFFNLIFQPYWYTSHRSGVLLIGEVELSPRQQNEILEITFAIGQY